MLVHLLQLLAKLPGQTQSWYIKNCEYRARNYLQHGRSIDSQKRARNGTPLDDSSAESADALHPVDPIDLQGELVAQDLVEQIATRLSLPGRRIFALLLKDYGVCEVARQIGVSHTCVVKHRKRIARVAHEVFKDLAA